MVALAEGVAGVGVAQLGDRSDIAGVQPLHLDPLLTLLDGEMVQLLRRLVLGVPDLGAVGELTVVEAEQGHVAHVGLGDGLEDPSQERRVAVGGGVGRHHLGRRREELDHLLEQSPEAVGQGRAAAEERHDLARQHRLLHRADELLAGDLLAAQVALDQLVVGGGHRLGELLVVLLIALLVLRRDRHHLVLALDRALLVVVAVAGEEVDDPVEVGAVADRHLHRDHLGREVRLHVLEHALEVRVLLVHERDEQHPGEVELVADLPGLLGADLDAAGTAQHDHGGVGRVQRGHDLAEIVEVAGGVDQVDLGVEPLGVAEGQVDRMLALDLVGGIVGEGGAVLDAAVAPAAAGHPGEPVDQRRLATRAMADERHIPDGVGAIDLHGLHLRP